MPRPVYQRVYIGQEKHEVKSDMTTSDFRALLDKLSLNGGVKSLSSRPVACWPTVAVDFQLAKGAQLGPNPSAPVG